MIDAKTVHAQMMQDDPEYAREYEALEDEFADTEKMIRARKRAGIFSPRAICRTERTQ